MMKQYLFAILLLALFNFISAEDAAAEAEGEASYAEAEGESSGASILSAGLMTLAFSLIFNGRQ